MSYKSLLFCPDEKTARIISQILTDVDFRVEPCHEPFAAVKKLMAEHFDAIVVDCENEQNAALLFKSAHNSGANQASLAVAVVEGQAGVAKAFRIGANLVLTKPINVEQSKGTLRVARGLLRKTDAARSTSAFRASPATYPQSGGPEVAQSSTSLASTDSGTSPFPQPAHLAADPAFSNSHFDLEEEDGPAPDPTEAALLESMPDPLGGRNLGAKATTTGGLSKEYPWQPIAKPMAEPMASALQHAAEAVGKSEFGASDTSKEVEPEKSISAGVSVAHPTIVSSGQGVAAAPALDKPIAATPEPVVSELEPPIFSSLGTARETDESSGGSKKFLIAAAILVAVGVAGYVIWPKLNSGIHSSAAQRSMAPAQSPSSELALPTAPEDPTSGPNGQTANAQANQSTIAQMPDITLSTAPAKPFTETKSARSAKATSIAPDKVVSTLPQPEPLVVKSEEPKAPQPTPPAAEPDEPPTPTSLGAASNADNGAISGIVSAPATNMPQAAPQTLKVSQGVAQGLLMKRVQPIYPLRAQQARIQGAVELRATIDKDGNITNLKVISGDAILTQAAIDAVKQWKYRPYLLDGQPVEIQTQITVNFKLP